MIRSIVILCLVASAFEFSHGHLPPGHKRPLPPGLKRPLPPGLKIKHGLTIFGIKSDTLVDLPLSEHYASAHGYIKMNRPRLPRGYCRLQLWCSKVDLFRVCIFTDETGRVAGVQFNIPVDEFTPKYDMEEQGFTKWTTTLDDHTIVRFYAFFQFFVSPDAHRRIKSNNDRGILRDSELRYSGFGGQLASVSTDRSKLHRIFTKQNCIEGLGYQYHYNMTRNLECGASSMSPFSVMYSEGQLRGSKISVIGTWAKNSQFEDRYEHLNSKATMYAVPNGPHCLYDDHKEGGLSMTFFFNDAPWLVSCDMFD